MNIIKKTVKFLIISMFFAYYFIVIALNFVWINEKINPLELLHAEKLHKLSPTLYLSTFPHDITALKSKLHIEHIVTIANPRYPISRELIKEEKKNCQALNIQFSVLPISYLKNRPIEYLHIKNMLKKSQKITLIHAYFFDKRLEKLATELGNH